MKNKFTINILLVCFTCFFLASWSDGPANHDEIDGTESPFSTGSCGSGTSCHGSSNSAGSVTLELKDANGNSVTSYIGGESYTIVLTAIGTELSHYGFQLLVLDDVDNTAAVSIGTLTTNTSNTQITDLNGIKYAEHSEQLPSNIINVNWVAPGVGTGTAKIFAKVNNVNNNDAKTGDQQMFPVNATITENIGSSLDENKLNSTMNFVSINSKQLEVSMNSKVEGDLDFMIIDISGKIIETEVKKISKGENRFVFSTNKLSNGIYLMRVSNGVSFLAKKFSIE
jgi:Reeler domain